MILKTKLMNVLFRCIALQSTVNQVSQVHFSNILNTEKHNKNKTQHAKTSQITICNQKSLTAKCTNRELRLMQSRAN